MASVVYPSTDLNCSSKTSDVVWFQHIPLWYCGIFLLTACVSSCMYFFFVNCRALRSLPTAYKSSLLTAVPFFFLLFLFPCCHSLKCLPSGQLLQSDPCNIRVLSLSSVLWKCHRSPSSLASLQLWMERRGRESGKHFTAQMLQLWPPPVCSSAPLQSSPHCEACIRRSRCHINSLRGTCACVFNYLMT